MTAHQNVVSLHPLDEDGPVTVTTAQVRNRMQTAVTEAGDLIISQTDHAGNRWDVFVEFEDSELLRDFITTAVGALVSKVLVEQKRVTDARRRMEADGFDLLGDPGVFVEYLRGTR